MSDGKRRIHLRENPTWRWLRPVLRRSVQPSPPDVAGVDYQLRGRAAVRAVRAFLEGIEHYELHGRRALHVTSSYRVPPAVGLGAWVPQWLAERVRFGLENPEGAPDYVAIRSVDVEWDRDGTRLLLHLDRRVRPGARAFVGAWLGGDLPAPALAVPQRLLGDG